MLFMKKPIITAMLICAWLLPLKAFAGPVSPEKAATVARNFWSSVVVSKSSDDLSRCTENWQYDGMFLFVHPQGGWVLVAADDAAKPILGYSAYGVMDPENIPAPLHQWLQGYQQQMDCLRANNAQPSSAYAADAREWYRLENGIASKDNGSKSVEPLLGTRWNQTEPYNMYCPAGTVTGCAATAQAQMMKFWNFPAFGNGNYCYDAGDYGMLSADFAHTIYDWQHMPEAVTIYSDAASKDAVATLMYHCGVSLNMAYGTAAQGGSSALGLAGVPGLHSIDNSLKDYFFYSQEMYVIRKDYGFTNESWRNALIAELDLGHPILYGGNAEQGGHGFVCDGYDNRQYMHFNFGWSGVGDGYYPVDSISPGVGGVGGNVTYTFNLNNTALIGAVPVYDLRVSDTVFNFLREGGADSLLLCLNDTVESQWHVSSNASWLTVEDADITHVGWIKFNVEENNEGVERAAQLTFVQGEISKTVNVVQLGFDESEMCTLTVVMECTHGNGWQNDASLSFESVNGYVYGTARLESGTSETKTIQVAPHDVYVIWHPGGGTDRLINYWVKNQYGEDFVSVQNAYYNAENVLISWPCAHVGIDDGAEYDATNCEVFPNPTTGLLHVNSPSLQRIEVVDLGGRKVMESKNNSVDLSNLPKGHYLIRIVTSCGTSVRRVVKK